MKAKVTVLVKTELEEAGEDTEGMIENTAKLQSKIMALTNIDGNGGINILTESGEFKSTYEILLAISKVWKDIDDTSQAALLELVAGKTRGSVVAALFQNGDILEDAYESALNSDGSALEELDTHLNSIQGRIDLFNNSVQTMWMNFLNDEAVKFIVDLGTALIKLVDTLGLIPSAVGAFAGYKIILKDMRAAFDSTHVSTKELKKQLSEYLTQQKGVADASKATANAKKAEAAATNASAAADAKETTTSTVNATANETQAKAAVKVKVHKVKEKAAVDAAATSDAKETATSTANAAANNQQGTAAVTSGASNAAGNIASTIGTAVSVGSKIWTGVKTFGKALGKIGLIILAVEVATKLLGKAWDWIDKKIHEVEYLREEVEELEKTYEDAKKTFSENLTELTTSSDTKIYATLEDEFKRLTRGVDEYGNNISLTSDQYERYKEICEKIVGINPKIAAGYDSATKAIGNQVGILSQLIELQKIQARENTNEYLKDSNLDKIASNIWNTTIKPKQQELSRVTTGQETYSADIGNYIADEIIINTDIPKKYGATADELIPNILASMGYTEDQISEIVQDYTDKYGLLRAIDFYSDYAYEMYLKKDQFVSSDGSNLFGDMLDKVARSFNIEALSPDKIDKITEDLKKAEDGLIDALLRAPFGVEAYDELGDFSQNALVKWIKNSEIFKIDPEATEQEVQDQLKDNVDLIQDMTELLAEEEMQAVVDGLANLDKSSASAREYEDAIYSAASQIWEKIGGKDNEYGFKSIFDVQSMLGVDHSSEMKKLWDGAEIIGNYLEKSRGDIIDEFNYQTMTRDELEAFLGIDWNAIGAENVKSIEDVWNIIRSAINKYADIPSVKTYSALTTDLESYNEVLKQTSEIITDNTEVSEEYKESLQALGISEKELAEYFDESNPLIVKNAKGLNNLVKAAKNNIVRNTQLAKSQARLQYYELYKKMSKLVDANGKVLDGNKDLILSYYDEMKVIEQTIAKYSRLEAQLLGNVTAYEEFQKAQESDAETDPISGVEEMTVALGEAFNTAELGTETAQAAISGLVPESVYKNLDTIDEKMAAIYDYFKNGKLSQYLDITFDEDGNIENAEMKLGNLRKFIEDGLTNKTFDGTDWQHFEFSDEFLAGLEDAPDKLQYFADKFNVTKDVAFAIIEAINDHDAEWLNGDYGSMFDVFYDKSMKLERDIYSNTSALAELNAQLASGKISAEAYAQKYQELTQTSSQLGQQARENIGQYQDLTTQINDQKTKIDEYTAAIQKMKDEGRSDEEIKASVEYKSLIEASSLYTELIEQRALLGEPTEVLIQFAIDNIDKELDKIETDLKSKIDFGENGEYTVKVGVDLSQEDIDKLQQYKKLWEEKHNIEVDTDPEETKTALEEIESSAQSALDVINSIDGTTISIDTSSAISSVDRLREALEKLAGVDTASVTITPPSVTSENYSRGDRGYAMANGTAHASGDWGLSTNEHNSLVGELGRELIVDPHSGRYYTVGDNGAEFVDLKKDSIIFNHKQTEELLKNGHINSRGKAYAEGNAHVTLWSNGSSTSQWEGTGYDGPDDESYDLSEALKDAADSADDFADTLDWIAIRMEEYEEIISKLNAQLENAVGAYNQNVLIDAMIGQLQAQQSDYQTVFNQGIYAQQAESYLAGLSDDLQNFARNGALDISLLPEDVTESQMEAIQKYREFAALHAEAETKTIELEAEIANLAKQKFDNVATQYENEMSLVENVNEQLEAQVSLMEDRGYVAATAYYESMMTNTQKRQDQLKAEKDALQQVLDAEVAAGRIKVNSDAWYEMVNAIYDVDAAIVQCTSDLESFQNAINDIYWANFDELTNRLDYLKDETQSLIDLMDEADIVITPETEDGWGADQVEWTKEGLASLGLYAQQMEIAEYQAKQYAEAIDDLTKDYNDGKYSETEYLDKLNELKQAQYDSIEAYYDAQDAIVDLNKTRVDAIKNGIEKEVKAYEKLIKKEKELLDAEKDAHDWEKSVAEQEKNISTIKRKLMAIEGDTSISATAKRKQLEAELAEAQYDLEEMYYDRSVENKQNALDKELENFQEEKDAEIEKWDKYLEDIEAVVAESLGIVQANASGIYDTLGEKAKEYDLTVSEAIMSPWKDGALAVSDYQTAFDTAMSSTTSQLEALKLAWQAVIDEMETAAGIEINRQTDANDDIVDTPTPPPSTTPPATDDDPDHKARPPYTVQRGDNLWSIARNVYGDATRWRDIYNLNKDIIKDPDLIYPGQKLKMPAYAKGTVSLNKSGIVNIDELGDELVLRAVNGRLSYMEKGSGIIPADLTSNLMEWGSLDPTEMLNQNRPVINAPHITNNETVINIEYGDVLHIDNFSGDNPEDLSKMIDKAFDKHMKGLNQQIRRYVR